LPIYRCGGRGALWLCRARSTYRIVWWLSCGKQCPLTIGGKVLQVAGVLLCLPLALPGIDQDARLGVFVNGVFVQDGERRRLWPYVHHIDVFDISRQCRNGGIIIGRYFCGSSDGVLIRRDVFGGSVLPDSQAGPFALPEGGERGGQFLACHGAVGGERPLS